MIPPFAPPPKRNEPSYLTIQFNTDVSNNAYENVRDHVLLSGVEKTREDQEKRTMMIKTTTDKSQETQSTLERIPGIVSVTKYKQYY